MKQFIMVAELKDGKLNSEVEMDESYFGGRRKDKCGTRRSRRKNTCLACWNAMAGSIRWSWNMSLLMSLWSLLEGKPEKAWSTTQTPSGELQLAEASWQSPYREPLEDPGDRRTKNHINGIDGLWICVKHILYNYWGVSQYHFPMYFKEVEYRFNHRTTICLNSS